MEVSCKILTDAELALVEREIENAEKQVDATRTLIKELNASGDPCDDSRGTHVDEGHDSASNLLKTLNQLLDAHHRAISGCINFTGRNDAEQQENLGNDAERGEVLGDDFLIGRAGRAGRSGGQGRRGATASTPGGITARDCLK
jgi:hypothetical protein